MTDDVAVRPAAFVLERLRQVPVVQRRERPDAIREQFIHKPVVIIEARLVHLPFALGKDPRPGDAEAVAAKPKLFHERYVFLVAVVLIAGDVARISVHDSSRLVREAVPDRLAFPVLIPRALDLVGRGRRPPGKVGRKFDSLCHGCLLRFRTFYRAEKQAPGD